MHKFFHAILLIIACVFFVSAQSISQSNQASLYSDLDNSEIPEYSNFTSDILLSNAEQSPAMPRHIQPACADNPPAGGMYRCRIEATSGSRTYRVELEIPQSFGKRTVNHIAAVLESIVLQRMVEGISDRFVARANHFGLTRQRSTTRKFRPTLPYQRTKNRKIREEAALVEAAVESVFLASGDAPGRRLKIKNYNVAGKAGAATPNSYYTKRFVEISINHKLLTREEVSDDRWGGVIAHEILHTLGWGHLKYKHSDAIEIFEAVIHGKRFNEQLIKEKFEY